MLLMLTYLIPYGAKKKTKQTKDTRPPTFIVSKVPYISDYT